MSVVEIEKIIAKEIYNKTMKTGEKIIKLGVFSIIKIIILLLFLYVISTVLLIKEKIINPKISMNKVLLYLWEISNLQHGNNLFVN